MREKRVRTAACVVMTLLVSCAADGARAGEWWEARARAIESAPGRAVRIERVGESVQGRAIEAIWIRRGGSGDGVRPTLVVVAGLDGRHVAGVKIALGIAERIAKEEGNDAAGADIVVVPCVNPDGVKRFETQTPREDDGTNASRRTSARDDADRDRRMDEDGPVDLNGDGLITQMRVRRPRGGLIVGVEATVLAEPDDGRLMRRADGAKGERGEWAVLSEGRDQDGDGRLAEDGARGVALDENFPYHWREFEDQTGPYPLSEPETRVLAQWLIAHPEVVGVVVYGPNDNIINGPTDDKMDATGDAPASGGVLREDKWMFDSVAQKFKDLTRVTGVGGVTRTFDGSLQGWAYAQLGMLSVMTPGWVRPDLVKPEEDEKEKAPKEGDRKVVDSDDGKWLALSDARVAAGKSAGFVEWAPFSHPQLGEAQIGGWAPGFRLNPPDDEIADTIERQGAFVAALAGMLPRLEVEGPWVERVGERTWRIIVEGVNTGVMPTRTVMGERTRRLPPTRWEADVDPGRVVSGARVQSAARIAGSGGKLRGEWVVVGEAGDDVALRLVSPECGDREVRVRLDQNDANGATGGGR